MGGCSSRIPIQPTTPRRLRPPGSWPRIRYPTDIWRGGWTLLARDLDDKRQDLVFIDYKSLGVRQQGSIYEGLLEFKLRITQEKMAVVKGKKAEEVIPYQEASKSKKKVLTIGRGRNAQERVYQPGDVYLENDRRERKASGSYYTPDHIVKYIVENTVGPVLAEKFDKLRTKFREAQQAYRKALDRAEAFRKTGDEARRPGQGRQHLRRSWSTTCSI